MQNSVRLMLFNFYSHFVNIIFPHIYNKKLCWNLSQIISIFIQSSIDCWEDSLNKRRRYSQQLPKTLNNDENHSNYFWNNHNNLKGVSHPINGMKPYRQQLFQFVHHRTENRQFPCDTFDAADTDFSGSPCVFPSKYVLFLI